MADVTVLNTSSNLSGATIITRENAYTVTGLLTFDRDPSAPFAVSASSAVVPNLDADKVDGYEASALAKLAESPTFTAGPIILNDAAGDDFVSFKVSGTQKAFVGLSGAAEGDSTTDLALLAETGGGIRAYVNGSGTEQMTLSATAGLIFNVASHAGGNNCDVGNAIIVSFTGAPTGIAGGTSGRVLLCLNNSGADITLSEEDAASSAANRFAAMTGVSITWTQGSALLLVYNGTSSRWNSCGTAL